jgi:uncharacterized RDD family membrane protein YckC
MIFQLPLAADMNFLRTIGTRQMYERVEFETPENIKVHYHLAGSGTRFLAWFADNVILTVFCFILFIAALALGASADSVFGELLDSLDGPDDSSDGPEISMVFVGLWFMAWSLGGFFYFGLSELLMHGQTIGKRMSKIRVVKSDGFSLDPTSILVRTIFRVVDQLPPLWIVPVISARTQRCGDLVAGTIVIADEEEDIGEVRQLLSSRSRAECQFRFTAAMLKRSRPTDFTMIESLLERWPLLSMEEQNSLLGKITPPLANRLGSEVPEPKDYYRYLEDLLAEEYHRQSRSLG